MGHVLTSTNFPLLLGDCLSHAADESPTTDVSNLVYKKILGSGSFKTVYLVVVSTKQQVYNGNVGQEDESKQFALAVQKLRQKSDVKDGLASIRVAQELHRRLPDEHDQQYFETIVDWWFQSLPPLEFQAASPVFSTTKNASHDERSQKVPRRFLGTKWLLALKPVYDMDLRKFCQLAPDRYPVGSLSQPPPTPSMPRSVAGIALTEKGAMSLAINLMHAGRLMHSTGLVHRDIKPKNIMLSQGRPVLIDFGFASFVEHRDGRFGRYCIQEPGRVRGELAYVLASDVAKYQACQEGDVYAMGKTLYQVLFAPAIVSESPAPSVNEEITAEAAARQNEQFRWLLQQSEAFAFSRFSLSKSAADVLVAIIQGLCREERPLSFAQAEQILLREISFAA